MPLRTPSPMQMLRLAVAVCGASLLAAGAFGQSFEFSGRVVAVADGDTVTVVTSDKQQHRVRFNGIDAPEIGQDFGQASKQHLAGLIFGKDVLVVGSKNDRYGRLVATVMLDSVNVNIEQLKAGMAWFYREYASDVPAENRPAYDQAEAEARAAKRGLWTYPHPVAPWDIRHPPPRTATADGVGSGPVIGNRRSKIYHLTTCPDYAKVADQNRVPFESTEAAERAGFRRARNCP